MPCTPVRDIEPGLLQRQGLSGQQDFFELELRLAPGPISIGYTSNEYSVLYGYIWAVAIEDGQARIYQVVDESCNPVPLVRLPVGGDVGGDEGGDVGGDVPNIQIQVATLLYTANVHGAYSVSAYTPNVSGAYSVSAYTSNVSSALDASQYTANVGVDESEAQYDDNVGASLSTQGYTPNVIIEEEVRDEHGKD